MLEIDLPTRLRPPVIASFPGPESNNLNDLILILTPRARVPRARFAVHSADARTSLIQPRAP
jgi:hypothetical protein